MRDSIIKGHVSPVFAVRQAPVAGEVRLLLFRDRGLGALPSLWTEGHALSSARTGEPIWGRRRNYKVLGQLSLIQNNMRCLPRVLPRRKQVRPRRFPQRRRFKLLDGDITFLFFFLLRRGDFEEGGALLLESRTHEVGTHHAGG